VTLCVTTATPVNDPGSFNAERAIVASYRASFAADSLFFPRDSARRFSHIAMMI